MQQIGKHFQHPQYQLGLINALLEQNQLPEARQEYASLIRQFPETQIPEGILAKLDMKR